MRDILDNREVSASADKTKFNSLGIDNQCLAGCDFATNIFRCVSCLAIIKKQFLRSLNQFVLIVFLFLMALLIAIADCHLPNYHSYSN